MLLVALLTLFPAGFLASKLSLRASFNELLPDHKPSVVEMRRVNEKLAGASTLTVVVTGSNAESLKRTIDALSPKIFADMLIAIGEDAPKAVLLSLTGTILVILLAFRFRTAGWVTLITLLCGVAYQIGTMAILGIKLNFLNFVSLPIGIGVGADYCINVMKRRELMGDNDLQRVLVETGGAVVLCSLTTTLGYMVLLTSINRAVQSFGLAAAIGEITTILAAILVLPAIMHWKAESRRASSSVHRHRSLR